METRADAVLEQFTLHCEQMSVKLKQRALQWIERVSYRLRKEQGLSDQDSFECAVHLYMDRWEKRKMNTLEA